MVHVIIRVLVVCSKSFMCCSSRLEDDNDDSYKKCFGLGCEIMGEFKLEFRIIRRRASAKHILRSHGGMILVFRMKPSAKEKKKKIQKAMSMCFLKLWCDRTSFCRLRLGMIRIICFYLPLLKRFGLVILFFLQIKLCSKSSFLFMQY